MSLEFLPRTVRSPPAVIRKTGCGGIEPVTVIFQVSPSRFTCTIFKAALQESASDRRTRNFIERFRSVSAYGSFHLFQQAAAAGADVIVVFLLHDALKNTHKGIVVVRGEKIDGLDTHAGVIVFLENHGEGAAHALIARVTLETFKRFEADAGVGIVRERVEQRLANLLGIRAVLQNSDRFHAHPGIRFLANGGEQKILNARILKTADHKMAADVVDRDLDFSGSAGLNGADVGEGGIGEARGDPAEFLGRVTGTEESQRDQGQCAHRNLERDMEISEAAKGLKPGVTGLGTR